METQSVVDKDCENQGQPPPIPRHRLQNLTPKESLYTSCERSISYDGFLDSLAAYSIRDSSLEYDWLKNNSRHPIPNFKLSNSHTVLGLNQPFSDLNLSSKYSKNTEIIRWNSYKDSKPILDFHDKKIAGLIKAGLVSLKAIYCDINPMPESDSELNGVGGTVCKARLGRSTENPLFEGPRSKSHHQFERRNSRSPGTESPLNDNRWSMIDPNLQNTEATSPSGSLKAVLNEQNSMGVISAGINTQELLAKFTANGQKNIKSPISVLAPCKVISAKGLKSKDKSTVNSFVRVCLCSKNKLEPLFETNVYAASEEPFYDASFCWTPINESILNQGSARLIFSMYHISMISKIDTEKSDLVNKFEDEFLGAMSFGVKGFSSKSQVGTSINTSFSRRGKESSN